MHDSNSVRVLVLVLVLSSGATYQVHREREVVLRCAGRDVQSDDGDSSRSVVIALCIVMSCDETRVALWQ
jgi:hypothetical protein